MTGYYGVFKLGRETNICLCLVQTFIIIIIIIALFRKLGRLRASILTLKPYHESNLLSVNIIIGCGQI